MFIMPLWCYSCTAHFKKSNYEKFDLKRKSGEEMANMLVTAATGVNGGFF